MNYRFMPHVNHDPLEDREPATINEFTAFKNNRGANVRGGDIWITNSKYVGYMCKATFILLNRLMGTTFCFLLDSPTMMLQS